jgi:prepilin signal peptidase PulO-like enzyme (type II secretory pathway)
MIIFLAIIYGLCFGSFANVVIYRLPRRESLLRPPSRCAFCVARLGALDLVPVLSWLALRGKCRLCKGRIPIRYPIIEASCAALFGAMAIYTGPSVDLVPLCLLAFSLLCVGIIDAHTQEIPDGLVIFIAAIGILWVTGSFFTSLLNAPVWYDALLGAAAGAGPLLLLDRITLLILKKPGFGYGDIKLMAAVGLFLGWQSALTALLFAVMIGGMVMMRQMFLSRVKRGDYVAFGPFLCAGVLLAMWFGAGFWRLMLGG